MISLTDTTNFYPVLPGPFCSTHFEEIRAAYAIFGKPAQPKNCGGYSKGEAPVYFTITSLSR
jgi:hypothetical protein